MRRLLILLAALAATALSAAPAFAAKRVALVIGNNDYRNVPKLQKAVNDARSMGDALKNLGFSVMVAENQTRQAFSQSLLAFDSTIEKGDTAFFFFAGHGFEIAGQNFLLPTDVPAATEGQEELVRDSAILADRIVTRLQMRGARTSILVFDACRNNPFERAGTRAVAGSGGLAPMTTLPEGVFSIFSAGPRQTALDRLSNNDTNPNSVFTRAFIKELQEPALNLVQVAQRTRRTVSEMADTVKHRQVPVYFDQMVDDVFLNGLAVKQADARPAEPLQQVAALPPVNVPALPPANDAVNAPIASFSRHNGGWTVMFSIADPTLGISWRMGEAGNFRETGFMDTLDPRTRKRMPNPSMQLDSDAPAATIYLRYVDANGEMQGPFPIRFDPEAALVRDQRKILDMTASSWLDLGRSNSSLMYYTHLQSYRCAIREVRIGFDSTVPDKLLKLAPCDQRDPMAVPHDASTYMKIPASTKSVSVELTFRDGSVSEIRNFPTMTMTTDINDIRELEERRRTATLRSDVPELEGLFAEQLAYTHSNGEVDTMAEYIAKLDNHYYRYHTLSFLDQDIRIVGHAALVTGRMTGEVTIDGQLRKLNSRTTVVWIRHDDRWQMLTFQSTPIPSF